MEIYLGDGAYCKYGSYPGELIIYTSNGMHLTNSVHLEPLAIQLLIQFIKDKYGMTAR